MRRDKLDTPAAVSDLDERIVTTDELTGTDAKAGILPLDRSTIWRMVKAGDFPPPIQLTASRIGWRWSVVKRWLDEREANPPKARVYFGTRNKNRQKKATPEPQSAV